MCGPGRKLATAQASPIRYTVVRMLIRRCSTTDIVVVYLGHFMAVVMLVAVVLMLLAAFYLFSVRGLGR